MFLNVIVLLADMLRYFMNINKKKRKSSKVKNKLDDLWMKLNEVRRNEHGTTDIWET